MDFLLELLDLFCGRVGALVERAEINCGADLEPAYRGDDLAPLALTIAFCPAATICITFNI